MLEFYKTDCTYAVSIFNKIEIHIGKYFLKIFINKG